MRKMPLREPSAACLTCLMSLMTPIVLDLMQVNAADFSATIKCNWAMAPRPSRACIPLRQN